MARACQAAGVQIAAGDTKVVNKGHGDGLYINTSGIGRIPEGVQIGPAQARPGDVVIVSGTMGDHGIAIMSVREGLEFETTIRSDSAPLHGLVQEVLGATTAIRCMRDPTRGGLSSTLNEIAGQSRVGIMLDEGSIPVREEVRGACELMGLDPLYVANEGKLVAIVAPEAADAALAAMRRHPLGGDAHIIGTVTQDNPGLVGMRTLLGSTRIVDMLAGDQLPRIC